jgi:hypothetical protein
MLNVSDPSPDARQIGATADELGHQLAEDADKMTVSFWASSPPLLVAFDIFSKVPQLADAIVEVQARPIAWETGAADFRFHNSACRGPSHRGPRIDCARPALTPIDGRRLLPKPRAKGLHIGGLSPLLRANETIAAARR